MNIPFVDTGTYPTRAGNRVTPLIDGTPAYRRICELIELARERVYVTVTFMWPSFQLPDDRGNALDVLERAARRGVDVRLICWRPDEEMTEWRRNAFWGAPEHFRLLSAQYPGINVRWDRAHRGYCQHQKSWIVDGHRDDGTAVVGSMNLNPHAVVTSDHRGDGQYHEVCVELTGPAVADVQHNFVQRWNEASERGEADGRWGSNSNRALDFPTILPTSRGTALVQVQRTTHAQRYTATHAPVGGSATAIALGERTIHAQYCSAIQAARRTIYLEQQYLEDPEIIRFLGEAMTRGVQILAVLPCERWLSSPSEAHLPAQEARSRLTIGEQFALCGLAGVANDGTRAPVYVHSKLMLVDDSWATVGSANLHRFSLFGNGELNITYTDPTSVRALRVALFVEHVRVETSDLDDVSALLCFRRIASDNRRRHGRHDAEWQGLAITLDAEG